jgi:hypothetical protein
VTSSVQLVVGLFGDQLGRPKESNADRSNLVRLLRPRPGAPIPLEALNRRSRHPRGAVSALGAVARRFTRCAPSPGRGRLERPCELFNRRLSPRNG